MYYFMRTIEIVTCVLGLLLNFYYGCFKLEHVKSIGWNKCSESKKFLIKLKCKLLMEYFIKNHILK